MTDSGSRGKKRRGSRGGRGRGRRGGDAARPTEDDAGAAGDARGDRDPADRDRPKRVTAEREPAERDTAERDRSGRTSTQRTPKQRNPARRNRAGRDSEDRDRPARARSAKGRSDEREGDDAADRFREPDPAGDARPVEPRRDAHPADDATLVREWKGFTLSPFQVQAVEAIRRGRNVLVSAPTGAGKTLVAEYAIHDAVQAGRRVIYTAPIKALSNQKYRDFRDDPLIDVGLMTGDVTIHPSAQVLIMTTEILRNAIFEDPGGLADVAYVIFDEVHFMDDVERGTVWEESIIFAPPDVRFICLSATISNLDEVGEWIEEIRPQGIEIVRSDHRPVPLHFRFFTERSGGFEPKAVERVRKAESRQLKRKKHGPRRKVGSRQRWRVDQPGMPPDPGPLFDELEERGLKPVLVFCFSRKDCERLARRNQKRRLLNDEELARMDALQAELIELFQLPDDARLAEVFQLARSGVGYHHAGMLPADKEIVERMFTSGLLRLLFTTETFALGINMPARVVVFHSLKKFDGVSFDYMRTRDFLQMAGRAGRQGIDDEGLVYSLLSPKDLLEAPVRRLLSGKPESVDSRFRLSYSSILHLVDRLGRERLHVAWEKSFNQFQHREGPGKQRDKNQRRQRKQIDCRLDLLEDLGYLRGDELSARGRIAQRINGYELQITELLFQGVLEELPPTALAVVFVGLIHEERRRGEPQRIPARFHGDLRAKVDAVCRDLAARAYRAGVPDAPKRPDWGLTPAVLAWMRGAEFEEALEEAEVGPGDLCRALRMALQLMRQVRRAIDRDWDLYERLGEARLAMNRDEVDARRQLELG